MQQRQRVSGYRNPRSGKWVKPYERRAPVSAQVASAIKEHRKPLTVLGCGAVGAAGLVIAPPLALGAAAVGGAAWIAGDERRRVRSREFAAGLTGGVGKAISQAMAEQRERRQRERELREAEYLFARLGRRGLSSSKRAELKTRLAAIQRRHGAAVVERSIDQLANPQLSDRKLRQLMNELVLMQPEDDPERTEFWKRVDQALAKRDAAQRELIAERIKRQKQRDQQMRRLGRYLWDGTVLPAGRVKSKDDDERASSLLDGIEWILLGDVSKG